MGVKVKLFASFQEMAGTEQVEMEVSNVGEILHQLADRFPRLESEMFTSPSRDKLRSKVKVMVNGRNIEFIDGLNTKVESGDRVAVFPPIAGG